MITEKYKDKYITKRYSSTCLKCNVKTEHLIRADISYEEYEIGDVDYFERGVSYQVVQCHSCEGLSFRKLEYDTDDVYSDDDGNTACMERETFYPKHDVGRQPFDYYHLLPKKIVCIYKETLLALNNNQPILTGIGIRATLESICKHEDAEGRDLKLKIGCLVKKGTLAEKESVTLQEIRMLGNGSAHDLIPYEDADLNLAIDIMENLMQRVFILANQKINLMITAKKNLCQ